MTAAKDGGKPSKGLRCDPGACQMRAEIMALSARVAVLEEWIAEAISGELDAGDVEAQHRAIREERSRR